MPISANDVSTWTAALTDKNLALLEGGERLREPFATYLKSSHPDVFQKYVQSQGSSGDEDSRATNALDEILSSHLGGAVTAQEAASLLASWTEVNEDAYELLNQLRPGI